MQSPDVTVVVAVYNTMPYLTKCLTSLVGQTIGPDRMEIIAVDDGSTDGSGAELDRFAARYPFFKVLRQANSGGPAAPSNRALDVATGRYVFFVGSDDYLGPQALERMVRHADAWESDVLAVRMAGVNERWVPRDLFTGDHRDVDLFTSSLPFALSNTKLFRRSLVEEHHIRYPEDLPVGSDQPFTLEACVRAARISVASDYEYYYAVKRKNSGNITFGSSAELRLECTERLMEFTARLLPPGPQRDAINHRHLHTELCRLLRPDFLDHDRATQERLCAGIGRLVKEHLNDSISQRLDVSRRVRLQLAAAGYLDALIAVIRQNAAPGRTPLVAEGDAVYAAYPCFRDPELALPDDWFLVTRDPAEAVVRGLEVTQISLLRKGGQPYLGVVAGSSSSPDRVAAHPVALAAGSAAGIATTTSVTATSAEVTLRAAIGLSELIAHALSGGQRFWVLAGPAGPAPRFVPLHGRAGLATGWQLAWRGRRPYIVRARTRKDHQLVIDIVPVTVGKIVGRVRRMIPAAGPRNTSGGRKNP